MYRPSPRKAPPTVIAYDAKDVRPAVFVLAAICAALAVGCFATLHTTRISCRRPSEYATARCSIDRTGLVRPLHADLRADAITSFDVKVLYNSKHRPYAQVRLGLAPSFTPREIGIETGPFGSLEAARALDARDRFYRFKTASTETAYEASLAPPAPLLWLAFIGGLSLAAIAGRLVFEQLRQLRRIRIVVDHDRGVVVLDKRAVPFGEVRDVIVEQGVLGGLSNGKGEHRPGYKLSVILGNFDRVAATREWRPGSLADHEHARQRVLEAMGRTATA